MTKRIYFDNNATTPVDPEVLEALLPFYRGSYGNPSSIHQEGRVVRDAVEGAREQVARLVHCDTSEVIFTSCGTEADNAAIKGVASALKAKGNHIITTTVEHPAVVNTCLQLEREGYDITWIPVDRNGLPNPADVERAITGKTILISAMVANNETGVVLPVEEIGAIAARHGVYFHCDAVQAMGKIPIDLKSMNIHLLALSGHKFHAPKGVGALVVQKGVKMHSFIHGGSQERNRRGGTENVAGIVALGKACELAAARMDADSMKLVALREKLEDGIKNRIAGVFINGHAESRLPNTVNFSFAGLQADSILMNLDLEGISASSGSACSSGTLKVSPVLAAMGIPADLARGSVRFSLGRQNTEEDVDHLLSVLPGIVERLKAQ